MYFQQSHSLNYTTRLLQDFYFQGISKNPGSIYATYLIAGERVIDASADNERWGHHAAIDTHLRSSPFLSSSVLVEKKAESHITHLVMSLVNEENLEGKLKFGEETSVCSSYVLNVLIVIKAKYLCISSFHIYSLSPSLIPVNWGAGLFGPFSYRCGIESSNSNRRK